VSDADPVMITLSLVTVVLCLGLITLGVCVAVFRRFPTVLPRVWLPSSQRSQPVRIGGFQALSGLALLSIQAPVLIPMPYEIGMALFAWRCSFSRRRRDGTSGFGSSR
jgi:hypothetical protein